MSYRLFLDDERSPRKVTWVDLPLGPWEVVRSYREFVRTIETRGIPAFVAFDHDLAPEHYAASVENEGPRDSGRVETGADCARWLVTRCIETNTPLPEFVV